MRNARHPAGALVVALAVACAPRSGGPPAPDDHFAIDTVALRADTWFLSHDRLMGRATGTAGAELAGHYIAARCRALGLTVHELPVPLEEARVVRDATTVEVDGTVHRFWYAFVLGGGTATALHGFSGIPRWVGGTDDVLGAGDRLPDLTGAVALTAGPLRPAAAARLHARGAGGMIHLLADPDAFALYRASRGSSVLTVADPTVPSSFHPMLPSVIASPELSATLLAAARAQRAVRVSLAVTRHPVAGFNVSCEVPGTAGREPAPRLLYTAHYDHLGVGPAGADGDSIYNGFSDNAAGVAMLLALARAFAERPARHTVQFLFFTGEERGLLGSDYYVRHPVGSLDQVSAVINLDAGAPPARPWTWRVAGGEGTALGLLARDVAAGRGWSATTSAATPNSDYFPFAREGVPAVFLIPGPGPYEGLTSDSSDALRRRWDRYHQPGDEWHPAFPFEGLARYAEFALLLGRAVDRAPAAVRRD